MMTKHQLAASCQAACAAYLPQWNKYRRYALYRRTKDFVQWLVFDISGFRVAVIPVYSIQVLAQQSSGVDLTLGRRVNNERGADLWIEPDEWERQGSKMAKYIVNQIIPSAFEPLTARAVRMFLDNLGLDHVTAITARGLAAITDGNVDEGRYYLQQAIDWYQRIDTPWARKDEALIRGWLTFTSDTLVSMLRMDADKGAGLLHLP